MLALGGTRSIGCGGGVTSAVYTKRDSLQHVQYHYCNTFKDPPILPG